MLWSLRFTGFLLLLVTALPLLSSGKWYIRWWDFPRLQIAILLLLPLTLGIISWLQNRSAWEPVIWSALLSIGLIWQASHVIPFSPLWTKEVPNTDNSKDCLRLLVVNLAYDNQHFQPVVNEIRAVNPDILLLIEINDTWNRELDGLRGDFQFHHDEVRGDGLGIAIWSTLPLDDARTRYLISERRPSIWASVELPSGARANFVGVHPTPPGLLDSTGNTRRDSRVRDAELILIGREIAEGNDSSWIVAGDFNDVAWSHTTRLFKRISGLKDPRVGRSFMGTYHAQIPPCRCPIDHVFLSDGFSIGTLDRKRITGSDHFGVFVDVNLQLPEKGVTPEPENDDHQDAARMIEEGKNDAEKRDLRK